MKVLFLLFTFISVISGTGYCGEMNNEKITSLSQNNSIHLTSVKQSVSTTFIGSLIQITLKGGLFLYIVYFLFLIGLAYFFEKINVLFFHSRVMDKRLLNLCRNEGKINEISEWIKYNPSSVGNVLKVIINNFEKKSEAELYLILKNIMDFELIFLKKNIHIIYNVIFLSLLTGLLGVISGFIKISEDFSHNDGFSMGIFSKEVINSLIPFEAALIAVIILSLLCFFINNRIETFQKRTIETGKKMIERLKTPLDL